MRSEHDSRSLLSVKSVKSVATSSFREIRGSFFLRVIRVHTLLVPETQDGVDPCCPVGRHEAGDQSDGQEPGRDAGKSERVGRGDTDKDGRKHFGRPESGREPSGQADQGQAESLPGNHPENAGFLRA